MHSGLDIAVFFGLNILRDYAKKNPIMMVIFFYVLR